MSTQTERPSAATSRENSEQTNQEEQPGGELAAAPCSAGEASEARQPRTVPMAILPLFDHKGELPKPYFDDKTGVFVVPAPAVKRTFHVSEIEQLDDSYGDKSHLRKLAEGYKATA